MKTKKQIPFLLLLLSALIFQPAWINSASPRQEEITGPIVSEEVAPLSSVEVRSLASASDGQLPQPNRPRQNPLRNEPDQGKRGTWNRPNIPVDSLIQTGGTEGLESGAPGLLLGFDGTGNPTGCGTCTPPDTVGDVGPNYYIQMVNATKVAIYNKTGALLTPAFDLGSLWPSGTCHSNAGDPVVLYDPIADRWVLTQFADPNHMCFAVSKTFDPTAAYWLYTFNVGQFPDYFKLGVWPDGYYMSSNETTYTAYAFNRARMLNGQTATFQKFTGGTNLYLPSDLDGKTLPPTGAPNYFYTFKDGAFHGGSDRIEIREFHVDWITPANSTFSLKKTLTIVPFTYTVCGYFNFDCISQRGTIQKVDALSEWPMFRFPYRNFGTRQSLVGAFTVGGGVGQAGAAIRWFELRNTGSGWALYQQGTFDPGDGKDRFMPSIAMDRASNIALGYSVSNSTTYPSIRYTVHRVGDPLGTMRPEATLIAGSGAQTASNRWGDYSSMSIDPADDLSFWYTNEYYSTTNPNQWRTRIGKFKIIKSMTFRSVAAYDGWTLEATENSGSGGSANSSSTTFHLGDDVANRQYRSVLHFDTSPLWDTVVITKATLKIKYESQTGTNPFSTLGALRVDANKPFFGPSMGLSVTDFEAAAGSPSVAAFSATPAANWYSAMLNAAGLAYINRTGTTQFRLGFATNNNNNNTADYMSFFSGNYATVTDTPILIVEYYVP